MRIAIHDSEREHFKKADKFPNYALMKISAYHKAQGDTVEWWNAVYNSRYDRVYSSKIFDFTPENPYLPKGTIKGGTGYQDVPTEQKLPPEIDGMPPDYSIYPDCDYAIGYLTRGCTNNCRWCVVPEKEGGIKPYRRWQDIVRQDSRKLVLMDNNILACPHGINQLAELAETKYKIDINQGLDSRLVTEETAEIFSRIKWQRYIRFSCDTIPQIASVIKAIDLLGVYGIKSYRFFIYLIVTNNIDNAVIRESEKIQGFEYIRTART